MIGFIFVKTKNGPPKMMGMLQDKRSVRLELFVSPSFLGPSQLDGETSKIFLDGFFPKIGEMDWRSYFSNGWLNHQVQIVIKRHLLEFKTWGRVSEIPFLKVRS